MLFSLTSENWSAGTALAKTAGKDHRTAWQKQYGPEGADGAATAP